MDLRPLAPGLFALALPAAAHAFSTDYTAAGRPIRWQQGVIDFRVDPAHADQEFAGLGALVSASAAQWNNVADVDAPTLRVVPGPLGEIGFDPARGDNASGVRVYRSAPPIPLGAALALTVVTLRHGTGEVVDADIMVDAASHRFAALSPAGMLGGAGYDIQNTLTHELGHVLGLREDPGEPEATMFPASPPGEVSKRDLAPVDGASLRMAYTDDGAPLSAAMAARAPSGGCGGARVAPTRPHGAVAALVAAVALVAARAWLRRGGMVCAAVTLLIAGPLLQAPVAPNELTVRAVSSARVGGILFTRALLSERDGRLRWVELPGGRDGAYEQRIYGAPSGSDLAPGGAVQMFDGRVVRVERAPPGESSQ